MKIKICLTVELNLKLAKNIIYLKKDKFVWRVKIKRFNLRKILVRKVLISNIRKIV